MVIPPYAKTLNQFARRGVEAWKQIALQSMPERYQDVRGC